VCCRAKRFFEIAAGHEVFVHLGHHFIAEQNISLRLAFLLTVKNFLPQKIIASIKSAIRAIEWSS
jgi:hypothetical protein